MSDTPRRAGHRRLALVTLLALIAAIAPFQIAAHVPFHAFDGAADPTTPAASGDPASPPSPEPSAAAVPAEPSAEPTPAESMPSETSGPSPPVEPSGEPTASPTPTPAATAAGETPSPTPTPAPTPAAVEGLPYVITFASAEAFASRADLLAGQAVTETSVIPALRIVMVDVPVDGAAARVATLRDSPAVAGIEPDRQRTVEGAPDDPRYPDQWALPRIGWLTVRNDPPAGSAVVAVLDTGVDATHPELAGMLAGGVSFVDGTAADVDPHGHGTWMAGLVAALTDNGLGVAGTGANALRVMPVTVIGPDGTGRDGDIINGIVYAVDHGADVILMAFSSAAYSAALQSAVEYAWQHDVVIVAAAGNDGSDSAAYPAGDAGVVGVSATHADDTLWPASNVGAAVFLAAPGADVQTIEPDGYRSISGTSAAAAIVAAAAGLLRAKDADLSNGAIVGRLARTAQPLGTREQTGNGLLDLGRAWTDTGSTEIKPRGAIDGSGPYVGPYEPPPIYTVASSPSFRSASEAGVTTGVTSLVISKPSGTIAGDTMIAAIVVRPNTATITAPSGWTLIRRQDQANSTASSQAMYYKVATSSEGSSYTWTLGSSPTGGAGGIATFYNASTCGPVDVSGSQANNTSSTSQAAPSVTTTQAGDMLITGHSFASSATWTVPSGMSEAVDVASETVPNVAGVSLEMNYLLLGAAGASGTKTATASNDADVGVGVTVAIKSTCTKTWDGGAATSNWGDAANWNPDGVPSASDDVSLTGANTINVNVAASTNDLTLNNASLTLTVNSAQSLTVTGNFTVTSGTLNTQAGFPTVSGTTSLAAASTVGYTGSGSQSVAALTYGNLVSSSGTNTLAGNVTVAGDLTVSGGTLDLSSFTANRSSAGGMLTVSNGATLRIGGAAKTLPSNYSTHSIGATSTIEYAGTTTSVAALNSSQSYGNLLISGSGVTTSASFTVATALTVTSGDSLVASAGTVTMASGSSISNSGTLTFRGLTIPASATVTTSSSFSVAAALTTGSGATFAPSGGTITLTGTGWSLALAAAPTFSGLTVAGTPTSQPSASFSIGGALTVNSGITFAPTGGTITVNNGASIANSGTLTLQDLTLAASAAVSATGNFAVAGTFTVNSGATFSPAAASVISGAGTLTGNGTVQVERTAATADFSSQYTITNMTLTNLTVEYSGGAAQTISALSYGNLKMNNASGATLGGDTTVNGTLTLTSGNITTGANTLIIAAAATVSRTSGHVVGDLQKTVATGTPSVTYEVGDATAYAPVTVAFASVTVAGTLTATSASGDHAQIGSSTINANKTANRTWTLTGSGIAFTTYTVTLNFDAGDVDSGADATAFKVGLYSGGSWSYPTLGTVTSTSTQASAIAAFGDFQVGEDAMSNAYRSAASGNWATASTWQRWDGTQWVAAVSAPSSTSGLITVQNGHTVTVAATVTFDETTVDAGGTLVVNAALTIANGVGTDVSVSGTVRQDGSGSFTINSGASIAFNNGGTYQHNFTASAGTIPTATWSSGSTVEVIGYTSSTTRPGGLTQSFYNFTWNTPNQTGTISLFGELNTVSGEFRVASTGSGTIRLGGSSTGNLTVGGDLNQTGGSFQFTSGAARTVTVAGNVSISGGTFDMATAAVVGTLNVAGDFSHTAGTITETSTGSSAIVFNGTGTQTYTSGGTVSNTVNFTVNSGATLQTAADATIVGGGGTFTLSSGATLGIKSVDGITSSGATGNIQVSGARTFSTGASYTYNGDSAQATGSGLPTTVNNLTVDNAAGLTLAAGVTVNGTCSLTSGVVNAGSANYIYISATGTLSRTSGHVFGYLARYIPTGAVTRTYEIGNATDYMPVTVAFASVSVAGAFSVRTTDGDHASISSSSINRDRDANRNWTLVNSGMTFTTYDVTFTFVAGDLDSGADTDSFIIDRYVSGTWTPPTTGTRTSTTTQATSVTAAGDFAIGEPRGLGIFSAAADIGSPTLPGYAWHSAGTYTVYASGADIWGTADQFHYMYKTLSADMRITARVVSLTNTDQWAKAGVMIRETTATGSTNAFAAMTPGNGMTFQYRATTNGTSTSSNQTGLSAPYWVRLTRSGNTFTAERSADGTTWTQQGSSTSITMASSVTVGLAVTSHTNSATTTAVFDNVSVSTPPTAVADSYTTAAATQLSVSAPGVLATDSDPENDSLTASLVSTTPNGSLTLNSDGSFSYTPDSGFVGADSFTYRAFDGGLYSSNATVTINVYASVGFQAEDYVSGSATGAGFSTASEGSALGGEAITTNGNNTNASGPPVERVQYDVYFPNAGATNSYHLYVRYRLLTDTNADDSGWALRPLDSDETVGTNWDQVNDLYLHGDTTYRWVDLAATAGINGVPAYSNVSSGLHSWWFGGRENGLYVDAFVFSTGANLDTTSEGQAILDTAVNDRPTAVDDSYSVNEDGTLSPSAGSGVLVNDTDPESDALTAVLVSNVSNGSLTLNSNGSFTYTPSSNFNGSDSFTYRAKDNMVSSTSAATVTITVNSVNDVPSFTKGSNQTVNEDAGAQSVTSWATAISAGPANESSQTVDFVVSNDNNGLFSVQPAVSATGTLTYTPQANANGSATVTIQIHDNGGTANGGVDTSAAQTFTITVNAANDAPVNTVPSSQATAVNMAMTFSSAGSNAISIADVDAASSPVQVQLTATNGTLTLSGTSGLTFSVGDGTADATMTFTGTISAINSALEGLTFTPTTQFAGTASVQIVTNDQGATGSGGAQSDTDSVSISVINTAPTGTADAYSLYQGNTLVVAAPGVLANDTDPNTQTLIVQTPRPVSGPSNGSLTLNSDGSFTYTPGSTFTGSDSFTYKVTDGIADSALTTVTITVNTTAYVSSSTWSSSFSSSRYLDLSFPAYLPSGSIVEGATFHHSYRSFAGGTTCYYFEVYSGATLLGTHGSSGSPVSCNSGTSFVSDSVSLPEINSASRANTVKIRLYVANSASGKSEHNLATVGVTYWLGNP
jgi:VCBS repeat-containing protein